MSLFAALTVAVGGLNAQSSAIGNVSDNLANAQTVGFKRIDTRFESLVTQSNSRVNDPGGVRATPAYQNALQGGLLQSQTSTDLAISGEGFFGVQRASTGATGSTSFNDQQFFTRRGDFTLNKNGYLVNGADYYLLGYNVDSTTGAVDASQAKPIQISALLDNPVGTSNVRYAANLPASATTGDSFPTSTVQVFDSLGNTHDMNLTWTKVAGTNQWAVKMEIPDATTPISRTMLFEFSGNPAGTISPLDATYTFDETNATSIVASNSGSTLTLGSSTWAAQGYQVGDVVTLNNVRGITDGTQFTITALNNGVATVTPAPNSAGTSFTQAEATSIAADNTASTITLGSSTWAAQNVQVGDTITLSGTGADGSYTVTALNNGVATVTPAPTTIAADTTFSVAIEYSGADTDFSAVRAAPGIRNSTVSGQTGATLTVVPPTAPDTSATVSFNVDFLGAGSQAISIDFGDFNAATGVTQFAASDLQVTSFEQNGIPRGSFQDLNIDKDGFVTLNYDNGRSRTLFQIPIVQFFAPNSLQREDGGAYSRTLESGTPRFSAPGTVGAGTIVGNALEGSNVDIADEFTKMIQSQRAYSANAQTVKVTGSMIEELSNLAR